MGFRITSWNVNGIRNPFSYLPWNQNRTYQSMFEILEADIVVMQETKIQRKDLRDDMVLVSGWDVHFSLPRHKKGYSGVAIYTRNATCCPIRSEEGITGVLTPPNSTTSYRDLPPEQQIGGYPRVDQLNSKFDEATLDAEGRCVMLEFPAFVLMGVYSPASRDDDRRVFREAFLHALDVRVRNLVAAGKQVVLTGDLNVIRDEPDVANLLEHLRKENMTVAQFLSRPGCRIFNQLVFGGRVIGERDEGRETAALWDLCRLHHPDREGMYTHWDTVKNTRPANNGSRIDYILCSDGIKSWFSEANIQEGLIGSDHCPVYAVLNGRVENDGTELSMLDLMNPKDMFKDGKRLRDWGNKDLLPMSARLIPEFDRRRNIKDMFAKRAAHPLAVPPQSASETDGGTKPSQPPLPSSDLGVETAKQRSGGSKVDSPVEKATVGAKQSSTLAKRLASSPKSSRLQKKTKVVQPAAPGQMNLKSFFQPKSTTTAVAAAGASMENSSEKDSGPPSETLTPQMAEDQQPDVVETTTSIPVDIEDVTIFDPVANKESWSRLLKKRVPPRCEHDEPCISLLTKKAGVNKGRSFYICPRPLGPSGEKEKNTEWRCGTFIWSSDWTGKDAGQGEESGSGVL